MVQINDTLSEYERLSRASPEIPQKISAYDKIINMPCILDSKLNGPILLRCEMTKSQPNSRKTKNVESKTINFQHLAKKSIKKVTL